MNIFKLFRKATGTGAPATSIVGTADVWINSPIVENLVGIVATTQLFKGALVAGTGIPVGSRIIDILNATTIVLDNNITASGTTIAVTCSELFPYGSVATDGTSLYYATQANAPIRTVAGSGVIAETIDGLKSFLTRVKSGSATLNDTPPIDNNDLTRKDYVENIIANSTRQFIIEGRRGSVYSDFIERGTGLAAVAKASSGFPLIVSAANGNTAPRDYINRSVADINFTGLQDKAENFLLLERNSGTGVFEPKSTVLQPIYDNLRSGTDREGKVYVAFDTGTVGDGYIPNSYNNNPDDGAMYYLNAVLDSTVVVSGTTSLRIDSSLSPLPYVCTPGKRLQILKNDTDHNEWTMGVFFILDTPSVVPGGGGVHTIFKSSNLHAYVDPADQLIKVSAAINQSSVSMSMYSPVINAATYLIAGNGNPLGLGVTGPGGQILAGNNYHFALQYDGMFLTAYLNGILCGEYSYVDATSSTVEESRNWYVGKDWTQTYDTRLFLGSYDGASATATGNFQHFVVDPYVRYNTKGDGLPLTILNQSFIPTVATCTGDTTRYDRDVVSRVTSNYGVMFHFNGSNNESRTEDYYGNQMQMVGMDYAHISTAQSKFGGSSLRLGDNTDTVSGHVKCKAPSLFLQKSWTLEFWVRPDSGSILPQQFIIKTDPYANNDALGLFWYPETTGTPRKVGMSLRDSTNTVFWNVPVSSNDVTEDDWNHIAITYDGANYRFFINGNLESTYTGIELIKSFDWLFFGVEHIPSNSPNRLTGYIDDLCVLPVCKYTAAYLSPTVANVPLDYGATPAAGSTNVPGTYQYYYDIPTAKMYKGYVGNYTQTNAVFIGEAYCLGGEVRESISYSIGTKLRTDKYNDYVDQNYMMDFRHNFGTNKVTGKLKYKGRRQNGTNQSGSEGELGWTNRQATGIAALWYFTDNTLRNSSLHRTGNDATAGALNFHDSLGQGIGSASTLGSQNTSAIFVEFERNF